MFKSLFSLIFGIFLLSLSWLWLTPCAQATPSFLNSSMTTAALFHFEGIVPTNLGIHDGQLSPCPSSPNCVVSQKGDETHQIEPISYQTDRKTARETLLKVLSVVPDTTVVEKREDYIHTESRSKLMGFVDDGEFYFPADEKVIQIRSAARLGESDLGVNRRRLEQIRLAMEDLGA
jgi:uncharacterized protein (DUF1499 family)